MIKVRLQLSFPVPPVVICTYQDGFVSTFLSRYAGIAVCIPIVPHGRKLDRPIAKMVCFSSLYVSFFYSFNQIKQGSAY